MGACVGISPKLIVGQAIEGITNTTKEAVKSGYTALAKRFTPFGGYSHVKDVKEGQKDERAEIAKVKQAVSDFKAAQKEQLELNKKLELAIGSYEKLDLDYKKAGESFGNKFKDLQGRITVLKGQLDGGCRKEDELRREKETIDQGFAGLIAQKKVRLENANKKAGFFNSLVAGLGLSVDYKKERSKLEREISDLTTSWNDKHNEKCIQRHRNGVENRKVEKAITDLQNEIVQAQTLVQKIFADKEQASKEVENLKKDLEKVDAIARKKLDELQIGSAGNSLKDIDSQIATVDQQADAKLKSLEGRVKKAKVDGVCMAVATSAVTSPLDAITGMRAGLYVAPVAEAVKAVNNVYHAEPEQRVKETAIGVAKVAGCALGTWLFYEAWDLTVSCLF